MKNNSISNIKFFSILVLIVFALNTMTGCDGPIGQMGPMGPEGPAGSKGDPGADGLSIFWCGELAISPVNPQLNWAYYNSADKKAYIWNGFSWQMLAQDGSMGATGATGANGVSIAWQGDLTSHPSNPQLNWAYYNSTDKISYIYNGSTWQVLAKDGEVGPQGPKGDPGISIVWRGDLASHPSNPELNWVYYNSTDKKAYIWDGSVWQVLAQDGSTGATGATGANGVSIAWQGDLTSHPSNPQLNWAYYNSTDKISYIYNGSTWQVLAKDGEVGPQGPKGDPGISIVWRGDLTSHPSNPELNWAYYNSTDKKAYIWGGSVWQVLAQDGSTGATGATGANGVSIAWQGDLATAPFTPELNWAYYDTTMKKSFIWDGAAWQILAQDGLVGPTGPQGDPGTPGNPGPNSYLVIFNGNGGTPTFDALGLLHGSMALQPEDPARAGSYFIGWFTAAQGGTLWNFATPITGNLTLYAQWAANSLNTYTVTPNVSSAQQFTIFNAETSILSFNFNYDPGVINASNITIENNTGEATKGVLTGTGKTRELAVSNVKTGNITIYVNSQGVSSVPQTVAVYGEQDLRDILAAMTRSQKAGQFIMPAASNGFTTMAANEWGMYMFAAGDPASNGTPATWTTAMQNVYTDASPVYLVNGVSTRVPIVWGMHAVHGSIGNNTQNLVGPHNIGLGAIAHANLAAGYQASYDMAAFTASEVNACNVNLVFGPYASIIENARLGKVYEGHSWDPNISALMVLAHVRGLQENGVAACLNQYMGEGLLYMNNPDQNSGTAYIGTLSYARTIEVLEPYRRGLEAWSLSPTFNGMFIEGSGTGSGGGLRPATSSRGRMHAHKALMTDLLKEEWGWTGLILSQYQGQTRHGVTMIESVEAGIDSLMDGSAADRTSIVNSTSISDARLDEGVLRILRLKKRLGLFEKQVPFTAGSFRNPAHVQRTREIAADSMVLLRNKNNLIQRIQAREFKNIYVIGQASDGNTGRGYQCGGWTIDWNGTLATTAMMTAITIYQGIDGAKGSDITVSTGAYNAAITGSQDLIIAVIAEPSYAETLGNLPSSITARGCIRAADMSTLDMAYDYKTANPGVPLLVISLTGRPIAFSTVQGSGDDNRIRETLGAEYLNWDGFISAWLPGTEGGGALADLLFTSREFFGKTPYPWFQGLFLAGPSYPHSQGHFSVTNPSNSNIPAHTNITRIDAMPIGGSGPWYGVGDLVYSVGHGLRKSDPIDTNMAAP